MGVYALTGGATGIGAAIKQQLRDAGHRVIVVDLKDADINADLSTAEGRNSAIAGVRELAAEGLQGLITCAGVASHVPNRALIASVNYFGSVDLVEGLKDLVAQGGGRIVLVSSNSAPMCQQTDYLDALLAGDEKLAGIKAAEITGQEAYSGSKQALARWMRRNTKSLAGAGISINAIAPGYTETPMTQAVANDPAYGDAIKQFLKSIPLGRPGSPADMANMVEFLLSDKASFICGSVLFVDGGHDAMLRPDNF
ncbi:MAG: SDR family oxidoreductase [Gammaproteobacteria bacterium]|uniref:SDR family oxidoreductase n=1 Tax=Pseudomaricurvus alcaniphilus TaxID=1166482 RepID=UPI00140D530F|nr:SDR family oxidoreductase [Pseudomaricurvus alcaniphilus]MBR9911094.1 SDR family oxidoreductase [Gammaproteobacteria bacterium]NHN36402.1 SDR family oxidoreductase [Pseudomaricurvus alcaniphilus]